MYPKSEWIRLRTSRLWKKLGLTKEFVSRWTTISSAFGDDRARQPFGGLLRVHDAQGQADLIRLVHAQCEAALSKGPAVSADRESIRVRRLPLR